MFLVNAFLHLKKQEVGSFRRLNEDHYVYPLVRLNALSGNKTDNTSEFWLQIKQREVEMLVVKLETRIENKVEDDILANGPSSSYRIVRELLAVQSIQSSPAGNEEKQR